MDRDKLRYLYYDKKLSMMDIAKQLRISHAKVYYWLKKHKIKRRSQSESAYEKQNPNGDPFAIKKSFSTKEKLLLTCGLMLYCGEGNRRNKHSTQLANLDVRILQVFTNFLRKICGVHKNKISLYVQLYKKFNKNKAKEYWTKALKIPRSQISVYTHTDSRSRIGEQRSPFGIARLQFNNYKLKNWIERESDYYLDKLSK
jgi:hypothetical protein